VETQLTVYSDRPVVVMKFLEVFTKWYGFSGKVYIDPEQNCVLICFKNTFLSSNIEKFSIFMCTQWFQVFPLVV